MKIEDIRREVVAQSFEILQPEDADRALLAHGGITPEDVKGVTVSFTEPIGIDIAFEV
jgi:hypothetical protein